MKKTFILLFFKFSVLLTVSGQEQLPAVNIDNIDAMGKKISNYDQMLTNSTEKYLKKLQKSEDKLLRRVRKLDSQKAVAFLNIPKDTYEKLNRKMASASGMTNEIGTGQYFPYLDSLKTSLDFLKQGEGKLSAVTGYGDKLDEFNGQLGQLQNKLLQTEKVEQFIQVRKEQLNALLSQYTNSPKSWLKELNHYKETAYYYSKQVKEYKESINDPDVMFKKFLSTLNTIPAFQAFMQKNSMLAALFPTPDYIANPALINGLQTISSVQSIVQQQLGSNQANQSMQSIQQQVVQGQSELQQLKNAVNNLTHQNSGEISMPDFKPNNQKTKTFLKRMDYGVSLQAQRANYFFPMRTNLNVSVGYRLSDKKLIGIALIGIVGWGKGWDNVKVTAEGVGMRLFGEYKAKGSLWITGGAEFNYLKPIKDLEHIKTYSNWTRSALLGISRKYKVNKKMSGNVQVLYDFLYKNNTPATEPIVFRVGYNF